jgi:hypothetical protein
MSFQLGGRTLAFGYHATQDKGRRQPPLPGLRHEDAELTRDARRKLVATGRDAQRNFALLAWMVRKHIDYVASFTFRAQTGDRDLDRAIEYNIERWGRADRCDIARRHPLRRMVRLHEAGRTIDGDSFFLKLKSGQVQMIEGDRITKPSQGGIPDGIVMNDHGLDVDDYGAVRRLCCCRRKDQSLVYERMLEAADVVSGGYYTRPDSTRGVSPLSVALNDILDIAENNEYALLKAKYHAMFGVFIKRAAAGEIGEWKNNPATGEDGDDGEDESDAATKRYDFDLRPGLKLEGLPGDSVDMIESKQPSTEWQAFMDRATRIVLLSLDIPFTFYNSRDSSYTVSRHDTIQYNLSCRDKRADNRDLLRELTEWHLEFDVARGELQLPRKMKAGDIRFDWVASGTPWLNPLQEVEADLKAVAGGLKARQDVHLERGGNFFATIDRLAEEEAYAKEKGVCLVYAPANVITSQTDDGAVPSAPSRGAQE